jgi:hypothetical protein
MVPAIITPVSALPDPKVATVKATVAAWSSSGRAYAGGIVAENLGTISNCYRSAEQTVTAEAKRSTTINTAGTAKAADVILTSDFHTSTLGWSADIWNFQGVSEGNLPTLK